MDNILNLTYENKNQKSIFGNQNITILNCNSFTVDIKSFTNLTVLNCSENGLSNKSKLSLDWFKKLEELDLSKNKLTCISDKIKSLSKLEKLDCSYNPLYGQFSEVYELEQLKEFNCSNTNLSHLTYNIEKLKNLKKFDCSNNNLEQFPKEIEKLINLEEFHCSGNKLKKIDFINKFTKLKTLSYSGECEDIEKLTNLENLKCEKIKNLDNLKTFENLKNLKSFVYNFNNLKTLSGIENLKNLTKLDCSNNEIVSLNGIQNLVNLKELDCSRNRIMSLNQLQNLNNLMNINCSNNQITEIPTFIIKAGLKFKYEGNIIENIHPLVTRFLNQNIDIIKHVYSDSQSAHNHNIQESVKTSLINLFKDKAVMDVNSVLNRIHKENFSSYSLIQEFCKDETVHSTLLFKFRELLVLVWQRIESNANKIDIKRILNDEMGSCKNICFTGKISRLINTLNGFYDDIKINIGSSEQIGNIILITKEKLEKECNYGIELHKEIVFKELKERDYDTETIEVWLSQIE